MDHIRYIEKTHEYYRGLGYDKTYNYAHNFGGFAVAVVGQGPVVVPAQTSEHPFLEKLLQSRDGEIAIHIRHVRLVAVVVRTG